MKSFSLCFLSMFVAALLVTACQRLSNSPEAVPTEIRDLDALATSQFMTENAPPESYRGPVSFPLIDDNLNELPNWRYDLYMAFDGVFASTSRPVSAQTTTQVWFNDVGPERRVVTEGQGELFGQVEDEDNPTIEGVRLQNDTFLVRDGVCLAEAPDEAALVADLRAGDLVGGVVHGETNGRNATINGEEVWRYEFTQQDLNLPAIQLGDQGRITELSADMWVSPEHDVVIRYYVNMTVENAIIFDSALPVTGTIVLSYDVYDIGVNPNITVPFGC